jgi:hypothetical protein
VTGAFEKVLDQPVPDRLARSARGAAATESKQGGNVLQFPARTGRTPATAWHAREWWAMAASLVLGAVISWRVFTLDAGPIVAAPEGLVARGQLASALEGQLASEQSGTEPVHIGLTFRARDGNYCRSFVLTVSRTAGLACRTESTWQVAVTDSSTLSHGELEPASSGVTPAVLRAIEIRADGATLDAEGEQRARAAGWSAARP